MAKRGGRGKKNHASQHERKEKGESMAEKGRAHSPSFDWEGERKGGVSR